MTRDERFEYDSLRSFTVGFSEFLHTVRRISNLERKDLVQLALKTSEECGELAQAVLSFTKAPGCAYKNKTREDVDEEAIDVMICAAAVLFRNQVRMNMDLAAVIDRKLKAWMDKIEKESK